MKDTIEVTIGFSYYMEKEINICLPLTAIESGGIHDGEVSYIDQINPEYLCDLFKDNGIDPDRVSDIGWEINQ